MTIETGTANYAVSSLRVQPAGMLFTDQIEVGILRDTKPHPPHENSIVNQALLAAENKTGRVQCMEVSLTMVSIPTPVTGLNGQHCIVSASSESPITSLTSGQVLLESMIPIRESRRVPFENVKLPRRKRRRYNPSSDGEATQTPK